MQVMAGDPTGAGMRAESGRGEDVLPIPFLWCVGVLAGQCFRHVDFPGSYRQVLQVLLPGGDQVTFYPVF